MSKLLPCSQKGNEGDVPRFILMNKVDHVKKTSKACLNLYRCYSNLALYRNSLCWTIIIDWFIGIERHANDIDLSSDESKKSDFVRIILI